MAGYTAHVLEQVKDNRLIRPDVEYVGPMPQRASATPGS
jgi:citrate synthase